MDIKEQEILTIAKQNGFTVLEDTEEKVILKALRFATYDGEICMTLLKGVEPSTGDISDLFIYMYKQGDEDNFAKWVTFTGNFKNKSAQATWQALKKNIKN